MKALSLPCGFPRFKTPTGWHRIPLRPSATHRDGGWTRTGADGHRLHCVAPPCGAGELSRINCREHQVRRACRVSIREKGGAVAPRTPRETLVVLRTQTRIAHAFAGASHSILAPLLLSWRLCELCG